ncbi:hypothetical protein DM02DRAFT_615554 [Periconia macrospinosa]|uniref:Uncharacterized protein n=1 Tax=Periconia macrospinosa TaxID=97972 RepID=A0A2V1DKW6_9PLEO|nr:hypothetical protein DM02DRAFT_615554 [Periconia macrospinosa]
MTTQKLFHVLTPTNYVLIGEKAKSPALSWRFSLNWNSQERSVSQERSQSHYWQYSFMRFHFEGSSFLCIAMITIIITS